MAFAAQSLTIKLPELDEGLKTGLLLKNRTAFREVYFTKPQTWNVLGGSNLKVMFQHAVQLQPHRSFLWVYLNGKLVTKQALDKSSVEMKTVTVPLPIGSLGDYNTLRFEVEQHYTDVCEDPLDPSLWTKIHADSGVTFNYALKSPPVTLEKYPFPLVDDYAYGNTKINFVVPSNLGSSTETLSALGIVASDLAQAISWKGLEFIASTENKPNDSLYNTVIVGTPEQIPLIEKFNSSIGNALRSQGGSKTLVNKSGTPLNDNEGVIYYFNNPKNSQKAVLIVTGNTPEAVYLAARYLANDTLAENLKGKVAVVNNFNPTIDTPTTIAKYIHDRSLTFDQLGYDDRKAEFIGAPPLVYDIRVMPSMMTTETPLKIDLFYSYSKDLNDELSTIEVQFNDISLHSEKLDELEGEKDEQITIEVPAKLVKPYNKMKVQFHMFPFKYGYCVDDYEDKSWGIVSEKSKVILPPNAKIIFPNLGLFDDTMYPYSSDQDLSNTGILISDTPTLQDYQAMLNVLGAIAKQTKSNGSINMKIATSSNIDSADINNRNIALVGTITEGSYLQNIQDKLHLVFDNKYKLFTPYKNDKGVFSYSDDQGIIQQMNSALDADKIITAFYGKIPEAVVLASQAVTKKENLKNLTYGSFAVSSKVATEMVPIPEKAVAKKEISGKKATKSSGWWPPHGFWGWTITILVGLVILFIVLSVLGAILAALFGRKG